MSRFLPLLLMFALVACASRPQTGPNLVASYRYPGLSCVPFARALTGLAMNGDAADWWTAATGRYRRVRRPAVGSVLVFRRTARLQSGHVSVVSRVVDARHIDVIQANWMRGELDLDQLVVDVSDTNDWTMVRVWYPPGNQLGTGLYPTYGFIVPPAPLSHDQLARQAEPAAQAANGG